MAEESKYAAVSKFISDKGRDVSKADSGEVRIAINQADYQTMMLEHGVTKDMLKQVADANSDYQNGQIEALADILVKDKSITKAAISTRTPSGVMTVRQLRQLDTRKPATGEPLTKFGVVSLKVEMKSHLDKDVLRRCAEAVEKATNK